jgi:tRNA A-37 threonylcarbamoyl transferase component Bud32
MAERRPSRRRAPAASRWLLGLLALLLVVAGGFGMARAASTGSAATSATQGTAQGVAVAAASRLSSWIGQVDQEMDEYAAAIVGASTEGPLQLSDTFQTLLTPTGDFTLLELTDLNGRVIAASGGGGVDLTGAAWLADLSATPLVTPISRSGSSLQWFVARLATTGSVGGALVGALQASQVANLLSSVDPPATAAERLQVVLPGGLLLYSSAMTTTLHAGLTVASMIGDGALSTRVASPAVSEALSGGSGVTSYTAGGVRTVAGYDGVALPGWVMGIVVTEPAGAATAAGAGVLGPPWLVPSLALAAGLVLLLALAAPRRALEVAGAGGRLRRAGAGLATLAPTHRPLQGGEAGPGVEPAASPPSQPGGAEPTVARDAAPVVGARLRQRRRLRGRYEILEVIGRGGEGQVLRALDHLHSRQVAIKVRRIDPHDLSRRRDVLNEASVLLRMTPDPHASVVREDFIVGDRYYLVMDWIDGTPLDRLLAEQGDPGLPLDAVLGWMGEVAEVLDHLHNQTPATVHGDVKPGNVILTSGPEGRAILVDFGISQRHEVLPGAGDAAGARDVMGSPGFMAPEMLAGAPPSPASDVFSLASTTFTLLVGHPPRLAETPDWGRVDPEVARALEAVLKTGLRVDPGRRPGSASALIASLRAGAAGPGGARPRWEPGPP